MEDHDDDSPDESNGPDNLPDTDEAAHICTPDYDCEFLKPGLHVNERGESPANEHWRLFHEKCTKCAQRPRFRNRNLCTRCKHFRLRHVLQCVRGESWVTKSSLFFGTVEDVVLLAKECTLCQFLKSLVLKVAVKSYQSDEGSRIYRNDPCILRLQTFGINASYPEFGSIERPIWRPGGLLLGMSFGIPTSIDFAPRDIFLHFRCLDGSPLETEERFFLREIEAPTRYHRQTARKARIKQGSSDVSQAQADIVKSLCSWKIVQGWLTDCNTLHNHLVVTNDTVDLEGPSLLVDVHKWCLVRPDSLSRYAALSYVWGPGQGGLKCTFTMLEGMMKDNALRSDRYTPLTIKDAMEVCRRLNLQYLWVDRLCIVQDDDELREYEIRRMAGIYSNAVLTIAAVDGKSAQSGLCGVSKRTRRPQVSAAFDGLEVFDVLPSYQQSVPHSPWSSRGWTYQEMCLSNRLLLFTEHQVFFRCASRICYEDPSVGSYGTHEWPPWCVPTDIAYGSRSFHPYDTFHYFREGLEEYARRRLSQQSDIFHAFSGITRSLYSAGGSAITFGLPENDIDRALLWEPIPRFQPRKASSGCVLPSWSWASHTGPLSFGYGVDVAGSDVDYFVVDSHSGDFRRIEKPKCDHESEWAKQQFSFSDLAEHLFESQDIPPHVYMSLSRHGKRVLSASSESVSQPGARTEVCLLDKGYDPDQTIPNPCPLGKDVLHQAREISGALIFNAPVASFTLHDHSALNNTDEIFRWNRDTSELLEVTIFNKHARMAGFIRMDRRWVETNLPSTNRRSKRTLEAVSNNTAGAQLQQRQTFVFAALSLARSPTFDEMECYVEYQVSHNIISNRDLPGGCPTGRPHEKLKGDSVEDADSDSSKNSDDRTGDIERKGPSGISKMRDGWWKQAAPVEEIAGVGYVGDVTKDVRFYNTEGKRILKTPMVNVMLLEEQRDEGSELEDDVSEKPRVYRRLGVGLVYLARWMDAEPQARTIILR